ncbi:transglycosylase SLT domain-containing protein [Pontibacter sp. G13]|uniref:transglycosylase SLT domain-containing protein n=1 Tax=Pontibacter sp. G13 TaxID=3074898 RepID=UPI00288A1761|nr:transglycosylase SLT domain-containing protein [Pontibacter sp. G13]WNJ18561.1 transglycosylase SLT domain-containing protein [Pontibacter sp. G13]
MPYGYSTPPRSPYGGPASPPQAYAHRTLNWRLLTLIALLLTVSNYFTYSLRGSEPASSASILGASRPSSLYLMEKAGYYIHETEAFEQEVRDVAAMLGVPPEWLMAVMYSESKFNPHVENHRGSGAVGLIQFMAPTVRELNRRMGTKYYMKDIRAMSGVEQMQLVYTYLQTVRERYGDFNSLTDLYLAILYPKAIGQDPCYALYASPKKAYRQNSGLDENRDMIVTVSDIDLRMKRLFPVAYIAK